jgi:nucleoside-diphosphate-sugar epimerase
MRALVTGSTGFIGSHLVERLLEKGYEVRALARKTSNIGHLKSTEAEIVFGDVEDYDSLCPAVKGVDVVFHAAGRVTPGWGRWQQFEATVVKGTENVLKASADAGCQRFLYISTGGVYGKACEGDVSACESTPCQVVFCPDTYYESAKLLAEKAAFEYHNNGRIQVSVIRPAAVYGPRDRLVADRVFRHVSPPVIVWPEASNPEYSIVFVSDAIDCAILTASSDRAIGQIYNVAPPYGIRFREFGAAMIRAMGGPRLQLTIPYTVGYAWCALMECWSRLRRANDMPYLTRSALRFLNKGVFLDGSKAREELGWEPKVSIEEGTRLYVQWRRSQEKK